MRTTQSPETIPVWLRRVTFKIEHNPNCPKPWLIRTIAKGQAMLDGKPYLLTKASPEENRTKDQLSFGETLQEACDQLFSKIHPLRCPRCGSVRMAGEVVCCDCHYEIQQGAPA